MDQLTVGRSWLKFLWGGFPTSPHLREKKKYYSLQERRIRKPLQCLGEVQEIAEEMSNAWD